MLTNITQYDEVAQALVEADRMPRAATERKTPFDISARREAISIASRRIPKEIFINAASSRPRLSGSVYLQLHGR